MKSIHVYQSKEWWREYRAKNLDKLRAYKRNYDRAMYEKYPERECARRKKWANNNKHKVSAHSKVHTAIRNGSLDKMPCIICGSANSVAHHEDYSKPLEVIWFCQAHHIAHHAKKLSMV